MRLSGLRGFGLRLPPDLAETPDPVHLAVFTADQAAPAYLSEPLKLNARSVVSTQPVAFGATWRRTYRIAVQLVSHHQPTEPSNNEPSELDETEGNTVRVLKEWLLDLRMARPADKKGASLVLHTDSGNMVVRDEDLLDSPNAGNATSIKSAASSIHQTPNTTTNTTTTNNTNTPTPNTPTLANGPLGPPPPNGHVADTWVTRWFGWGHAEKRSGDAPPLVSLAYSDLVDLWTLQRILDEARAASQDLASQINGVLPRSALPLEEEAAALEARLAATKRYVGGELGVAERRRRRAKEIRDETRKRKNLLSESLDTGTGSVGSGTRSGVGSNGSSGVPNAPKATPNTPSAGSAGSVGSSIRNEQSRLASQLMEIFPISPIADGRFHFAIRGLILPSVFAINSFDTTQIAAALGFVAQVVVSLARYLDIALPYPITVCGSQSYITDPISVIRHGSTKFPLWTRGALLYRVEYALYLLHKDIDVLLTALGLAVIDLKQTLANLQNALLVVSSERT